MNLNQPNLRLQQTKERLILALDVYNRAEAEKIISETSDYIGYYKIGLGFLADNGIEFAASLARQGYKIFLDLKLFDIPQTVTDSVARLSEKTQASLMTVHGDQYVVSAAIKGRALSGCTNMCIYGVTVLTSLEMSDLASTGYQADSIQDLVANRARYAALAGADGVIASAKEASIIKGLGYGLKVITPGIRSAGALIHDQKRVVTPTEALKQGADKLVIGREITKAESPAGAASQIFNSIMDFDYTLT